MSMTSLSALLSDVRRGPERFGVGRRRSVEDDQGREAAGQTMKPFLIAVLLACGACSVAPQGGTNCEPLKPGDHERTLTSGGRTRTYLVHVPKTYDPQKPVPVVLVYHGAGTNAAITVPFTGMSKKADEAGFIAVYPNGTGIGPFLTWNAGGLTGKLAEGKPDDVSFTADLLDDLAKIVNVDAKRVFATGMSNGGMMCHRLSAELSDRIAAVAPVAGTMAVAEAKPKRPVPVLHFHGTADRIVPFNGPGRATPAFMTFKSVEETIRLWRTINECPDEPKVVDEPVKYGDPTKVKRKVYGPGKDGAEVVLVEIEGGGHTWPGQKPMVWFIGKSTMSVSANDLMWEFFQRHPMK